MEVSSILYVGLKCPIECWPKSTVFICGTKNSDCDWVYILLFHKNGTGVAFDARRWVTLCISIASCWMVQSWTESQLSFSKRDAKEEILSS